MIEHELPAGMDGHADDAGEPGAPGGEPGAPGADRLRELRRAARRTQLWVEAEADLGTGYLQRLESGKVARPAAATLERILAALGARYSERRETLERFGYVVATPLPDAADVAWAREASRRDLAEVALPAYVLDCTHRLLAWNRFVPPLLGVGPGSPVLDGLGRRSMIAHWFDPGSPVGSLVAEPAVFLPAVARALRAEMARFRREPWGEALIAGLAAESPLFREVWEATRREPATASAARALVPVRLRVPGAGLLSFHLSSEPFARDARFRVIYLFPADPGTMRRCATWATETQEPRHGDGATMADPVERTRRMG